MYCYIVLPLDLHVLSLPLAFILSQDQTLHCNVSVDLDSLTRSFMSISRSYGPCCSQNGQYIKERLWHRPCGRFQTFSQCPPRSQNVVVFPWRGGKCISLRSTYNRVLKIIPQPLPDLSADHPLPGALQRTFPRKGRQMYAVLLSLQMLSHYFFLLHPMECSALPARLCRSGTYGPSKKIPR